MKLTNWNRIDDRSRYAPYSRKIGCSKSELKQFAFTAIHQFGVDVQKQIGSVDFIKLDGSSSLLYAVYDDCVVNIDLGHARRSTPLQHWSAICTLI